MTSHRYLAEQTWFVPGRGQRRQGGVQNADSFPSKVGDRNETVYIQRSSLRPATFLLLFFCLHPIR